MIYYCPSSSANNKKQEKQKQKNYRKREEITKKTLKQSFPYFIIIFSVVFSFCLFSSRGNELHSC